VGNGQFHPLLNANDWQVVSKMKSPKVVFYISGHGYGHATRQITIINHLKRRLPEAAIVIRSNAPRWLFENNLRCEFEFDSVRTDVGVVQKDSLRPDKEETLRQAADFFGNMEKLIEVEVKTLQRRRVNLIVGDIPPLAFEVASRLKIAGVAISNFSWDWIYAPYIEEYPGYASIIEVIKEGYNRADLLLRLPFYGDTSAFRQIYEIPLVGRKSIVSREETHRRYNLPSGKKYVLLSFGTYGLKEFNFEEMEKLNDYFFIATFMLDSSYSNLLCLRGHDLVHEDLVAACDVVITKPGYGIVAESLINRTPVLYTSRGDFAEYPELVKGLRQYGHSLFIPNQDFLNGNWGGYLERLLEKEFQWPEIDFSGDAKAADLLLEKLKQRN
jgi:hypothetical protein